MPTDPPRTAAGFSTSQVKAWAIALSMVYGTIGFALMGLLIDWLAGTRPWFTIGLAMLGLGVGMYRFIKEAQALNRSDAARRRGRSDAQMPSGTGERESGPPDRKKGP